MHGEVVEVLLDVQNYPKAVEGPRIGGVESGGIAVRVERVADSQVSHGDVEELLAWPDACSPHAESVSRDIYVSIFVIAEFAFPP